MNKKPLDLNQDDSEIVADWLAPFRKILFNCAFCNKKIKRGAKSLPIIHTCSVCANSNNIQKCNYTFRQSLQPSILQLLLLVLASTPERYAAKLRNPFINTNTIYLSDVIASTLMALTAYFICYVIITFTTFKFNQISVDLNIDKNKYVLGILNTWGWLLVLSFSGIIFLSGMKSQESASLWRTEYDKKMREAFHDQMMKQMEENSKKNFENLRRKQLEDTIREGYKMMQEQNK